MTLIYSEFPTIILCCQNKCALKAYLYLPLFFQWSILLLTLNNEIVLIYLKRIVSNFVLRTFISQYVKITASVLLSEFVRQSKFQIFGNAIWKFKIHLSINNSLETRRKQAQVQQWENFHPFLMLLSIFTLHCWLLTLNLNHLTLLLVVVVRWWNNQHVTNKYKWYYIGIFLLYFC